MRFFFKGEAAVTANDFGIRFFTNRDPGQVHDWLARHCRAGFDVRTSDAAADGAEDWRRMIICFADRDDRSAFTAGFFSR